MPTTTTRSASSTPRSTPASTSSNGRRLLGRRVGGDRRQSAQGPPRRCRAGDEGVRPDGRQPQPSRQLAAVDHCRGRRLAAAAADRLDRPVPDPPPGPEHRHRRDARRPDRPGPAGQGPLHRLVLFLGWADRRGAVGGTRAAAGAFPHRAAALLAARARDRARRAADRAAPRHGHPHLQPACRRLALGQLERRQLPDLARAPAARRALRHVAAREPPQARGSRAVRDGRRRRGRLAHRAGRPSSRTPGSWRSRATRPR